MTPRWPGVGKGFAPFGRLDGVDLPAQPEIGDVMWNFDRPIRLCQGAGDSVKTACWMSAVSVFQGSAGDNPNGVCEIIRRACIRLNDGMPDDATRARFIGPILFEPVDTYTTDRAVKQARAYIAADYAVRVFAPIRLEFRGFKKEAAEFRALPKVVDKATALQACDVAWKVRTATAATAAAADVAAYAAAAAAYAADAYASYAAAAAAYAADAATAAAADVADRDHIWEQAMQMVVDMCQVGRKPRTNMADPEGVARVLAVIGR